jgi:CheY-like chemotaxis protein
VILIVDDDPSIRRTLVEVLENEGYEALEAGDGAEALAVIEAQAIELILLDMRMPVMDGWAFAHELEVRARAIPIVVMTAARTARAWAEEIHAQGYLAKPFELPEFYAAIRKWIPQMSD